MSDVREEFEASGVTLLLSRCTEPGYTDLYADSHTQMAWKAWQASRAALKVELPDRKQFVEYYEGLEGGEFNWRKYLTAVTEALQQAGIEVK